MLAVKYDFETDKEVQYFLPEGTSCHEALSADTKVSCAHCGRKVKFGDTYTSRQIFNYSKFGYSVCVDCYIKEIYEIKKQIEKRHNINNTSVADYIRIADDEKLIDILTYIFKEEKLERDFCTKYCKLRVTGCPAEEYGACPFNEDKSMVAEWLKLPASEVRGDIKYEE